MPFSHYGNDQYKSGPGTPVPAISLPTSIAGLFVWLKADVGLTLSGSAVTDWTDQSTGGSDMTQTDAAHRPERISSGLNSMDIVRFAHVAAQNDGDFMVGQASDPDFIGDSTGTVMGLLQIPTNTLSVNNLNSYSLSFSDNVNNGLDISTNVSTVAANELWRASCGAGTGLQANGPTGAISGQGWKIVAAVYDNAATPRLKLYVDGTEVATNNASSGTMVGRGYFQLGTWDVADGKNNGFDLAECMVWETALSQTQINSMVLYLQDRWGV